MLLMLDLKAKPASSAHNISFILINLKKYLEALDGASSFFYFIIS